LKLNESRYFTNYKLKLPEDEVLIDFPKESFGFQRYTDISTKLSILTNWLAYFHLAVLEKLDLIDEIHVKEFSNWLLETFCSLKGDLKSWSKKLMETHKLLIQKLALKTVKFKREAPDVSFSMMKFYYKNFEHEIWAKIDKLSQGSSPEGFILNTFKSKALSEEIMVDPSSSGFYQSTQLEELKIPKIEVFPPTMKPGNLYSDSRVTFSQEEISIQSKFKTFPPTCSTKFQKIKDTKMVYCEKKKMENGVTYWQYQIRFISPNVTCNSSHLNSKLHFLLFHLKICHNNLISLQNERGMNTVPNAKEGLIEWFKNLLFKSEYNTLGIVGDVTVKENESESDSPLEFGPSQKYLINEYFIPRGSHTKVIQVSLALIFYWYKKFNPSFFFESDQEYWKEMIESLGIILDNLGTYSTINIDPEGNFTGS
jgi:hypothetical protein